VADDTVRAAIAERLERLQACFETQGGHFELYCYKQKLKNIDNLFSSKNVCFVQLPA
jgi:hypothetical protein